jgi:prolyl 4-hydroxylase
MEIILLVVAVLVVVLCLWVLIFGGSRKGRGFTDSMAEWDPPVVVDSILTPDECKYIIDKATPLFTRSGVVGYSVPNATRTSETAWIEKDDPIAQKVFQKVVELTGKSLENCENLQVVRYQPGTYYKAHHDSCCDDSEGCQEFSRLGGQRVATLLIYLNSEFTDGETHFPSHGDLKIKADPGSAIFFRPLARDVNKCHPKALHAGLPISTGTKYVCNVWVREDNFVRF